MSVEFIGVLYAQPNESGQSLLVGVGSSDRYTPLSGSYLSAADLHGAIESLRLYASAACDAAVIFCKNGDFSGPFAQATNAKSGSEADWNVSGTIGSALCVASNRTGKSESRISFRDQFLSEWDSMLDGQLGSQASRNGDPTLTWEMFPANISYLDKSLTYLKIYQPLTINMPWYWPNYSASITYHVYLYITGDSHLRGWVARWAYWVEGGLKSGKIADQLQPQVIAGMQKLQDQLNSKLTLTDLLGPLDDIYYLPGRQLTPVPTGGITGNTTDDITIVVEKK